jgi:amino acid transporter
VSETATTQRERLGGARKLTLLDAVAQSIGFIGPVFSIAFLVPLLVGLNASGKGAGTAAPLAVLLAAIGVMALGWIVAQYAKRIHAAGSLYDYVTAGLGGRVGAAAGLLYYVGILVLGAGLLVMIGGTIYDTLDAEFGITPLPRLAWMLIIFVLISAVLYSGVALSTRTQLVLALVSITVVLLFFLHTIISVGAGNDVGKAFSPSSSPQGLGGVLFGVLYGVLLFIGFETAANLGEETAHPKRDIPRAVMLAVGLIAGYYIIGAYAQVAGFHFSLAALGKNAGAPLFALAGPASGGGFGSVAIRRLVELVVILDMLAVLIGVSVSGSRGFFALGRDHRLPRFLGRVSRRGTPLSASAFLVAIYLLVIFVTVFWNGLFAQQGLPHYVAIFSWGASMGGFALACIYLLMSVGALRGLAGHPRRWAVILAAVVGIVVTAAAIFGSVDQVGAPTIWAIWAALGVLVLGFAFTFVFPGLAPAASPFDELTAAERGPQKA